MTNYSNHPGHCELTWFKDRGEYYTTQMLDMTKSYDATTAVHAVASAIVYNHHRPHVCKNMWAVVMEPYCIHPYPVMIHANDIHDAALEQISWWDKAEKFPYGRLVLRSNDASC